eukprot:4602792-Prymnesium_polylepis.1
MPAGGRAVSATRPPLKTPSAEATERVARRTMALSCRGSPSLRQAATYSTSFLENSGYCGRPMADVVAKGGI